MENTCSGLDSGLLTADWETGAIADTTEVKKLIKNNTFITNHYVLFVNETLSKPYTAQISGYHCR